MILSGVDDKHVQWPAVLRNMPDEERDEALLRERSLLYVAASRARDALVVTWSGNVPSCWDKPPRKRVGTVF